jgi:asparagine synthase (glutamine-hydrolysing)
MTFPAGTAANEDEFLVEIEKAFGTPIARLPICGMRLLVDADRVVHHLELPALLSDATHAVFERARDEDCSVVLDGFFGDHMLFGRSYLVDLALHGRWLKVRGDLREFGTWMTDAGSRFFAQEFRSRLARAVCPTSVFRIVKRRARRTRLGRYPSWYRREFLERVLARQLTRFDAPPFATRHAEEYYRSATAGHDLTQVQLQTRAGLMHGVEVRYPFRDRDLVAFLSSIPGEVVNHRGVPKGLLREAVAGTLPEAIRMRRWKADFTDVHRRAVLRELPSLVRLLSRDCFAVRAGLVDGEVVEPAVQAAGTALAESADPDVSWHLKNLVGLELWLRHFFGDQLGRAA